MKNKYSCACISSTFDQQLSKGADRSNDVQSLFFISCKIMELNNQIDTVLMGILVNKKIVIIINK